MGDTTRIPIRQVGVISSASKHAEHFYRRVPTAKPVYQTDEGELMPRPKKVGAVEVAMADATTVKVRQKDKEVVVAYEATERPDIRFRGKLSVSELEVSTTVAAAERTEVLTEEESVTLKDETNEMLVDSAVDGSVHTIKTSAHGEHELAIDHLPGRSKMHTHSKQAVAALPLLSNPDGIIGMQRARIVDRNPHDATLKVNAPLLDTRATPSPAVLTVVALSAFLIAIGVVGLYSQVSVEANAAAQAYQFTFQGIFDVLKINLTALLVHSF